MYKLKFKEPTSGVQQYTINDSEYREIVKIEKNNQCHYQERVKQINPIIHFKSA